MTAFIRNVGTMRLAGLNDEKFFYDMRVKAEAMPWYKGAPVDRERHHVWYLERLSNPLVGLYVWEEDGIRSGIIRTDSNDELAFDVITGCNIERMLSSFVKFRPARYKVTLDKHDALKARLLERAGFQRFPATFLCFRP